MPPKGVSSVPKFGSFKRKPESVPTPEQEAGQKKTRQEDSGAQSHHRRPRHRQDDTSSSALVRSSEREHSRKTSPPARRFDVSQRSAAPRSLDNELFTIDKRGDPLIRRYGGNDRYAVPSYRRFGRGRLLGSDAFFRTEPNGNREVFFLRSYHDGASELSRDRKSILAKSGGGLGDVLRLRQDKAKAFTGTEDFLPLKQSKKRKRSRSGSDDSVSADRPSYRSIHGMSKRHEEALASDENYSSDSSMDSSVDTPDPIKMRSIDLTARVKDNPADIPAWIELVEHQDVLRDLHSSDGRSPTLAEVKSYADIKLSMLEKAMKHCQTPDRVTDLRLRMMVEGEKIWDLKTANHRWEDLMASHGNDFRVWTAYMNFKQTNLPQFTYEGIKRLYVEKLRSIKSQLATVDSESGSRVLCCQLVIVHSRALQFIADAGYAELAMAAWQAILELHFQRPPSLLAGPQDMALASLQNFWESEVPRIGEDGAKGWAVHEINQGSEEPPEPRTWNNFDSPPTRDHFKAWATVERHKAQEAKCPARTMDDGIEDDPYRVVMYADFEDLLFFAPQPSLPLMQEQLLDTFPNFCQMPPVLFSSNDAQPILHGQFLNGGQKACITDRKSQSQQDHIVHGVKKPDFSWAIQSLAKTTDVLFPLADWFKYTQPANDIMFPEQRSIVSNVLKQLCSSVKIAELATYYLAYDNVNNPGSRKKTAKTLLKDNPSHVDLYLGFARAEFSKNSGDTAKNILSAALGLTGLTLHDRLRLCISQSWMDLYNGHLTKALAQLCLVMEEPASEDPVSPARMLKCRELLTRNRDQLLSSRAVNDAVIFAEALSLLEYMTGASGKESQSGSQGDIWSAVATVKRFSDQLTSRGLSGSPAQEKLFQAATHLLYYHSCHGPYRPGFFRECIEEYIRVFPRNTMFLVLYAWREDRIGIEDRVRSILDGLVLSKQNDCVSSRIFAIKYEMAAGNAHSTRAAFDRAVESDSCKHNAGIWISYIRYCHDEGELRPKAKSVFYRAIQRCPWSKDVFMEAFVTLSRDMDSSELRSVYSTLCDKGLRVHVELDEFVAKWKSNLKQRSGKR
ncbi:hypothetical protein KJ359_011152 [Pestalotiopsis sp. 9143b]|nr:hypothetical protein KJ359_011152 [Pestalotiopsis sp. 9143b]